MPLRGKIALGKYAARLNVVLDHPRPPEDVGRGNYLGAYKSRLGYEFNY